MNRLICAAIILSLTGLPALAAPPEVASDSLSAKQPWEWTDAERLAGRFDPAFLKAIRHLHHAPPPGMFGSDEPDSYRTGPIYGEINPELILPFEAFNYLLFNVSNDHPGVVSDHFHAMLDARLVSFGYKDPNAFWSEFGTAVHDHLVLTRKTYDMDVQLQHATDSERKAIKEKQGFSTCRSRMEALALARAHFGRATFDRLLYTVAAPGVSPGVRPGADEEYQLAFFESGCQSEAASLLVAAAATATPARASAYWNRGASPATKTPWEWTDAERLAFRLDPNVVETQAPIGTGGAKSQKIVGVAHPEAFFPFELFGHLLQMETYQYQEHDRDNPRLFAYGVANPDAWRQELHTVLAPYTAADNKMNDVAARLQKAGRDEKPALEEQLADLRRAQCRSTAQGLDAAREHYGRETFDRFLYMVVAPELTVINRMFYDDLAKQIAYEARGCGSSTSSTLR